MSISDDPPSVADSPEEAPAQAVSAGETADSPSPAAEPETEQTPEANQQLPEQSPAEPAQPSQSSGPTTIPLSDLEPEALPPPLEVGAVIADRYQVEAVLSTESVGSTGTNTYRVLDTQGYRRCWACGSESSLQGDIYCVECGAELAGHHYRVQEFLGQPQESPFPIPDPVLRNEVPGIAHVYDLLQPGEEGRSYVVWEEAHGETLSYLAVNHDASQQSASAGAQPPEPAEEQALSWMAQAADLLTQLHSAGILGCTLNADNLLVQPDDRLILLDASGCQMAAEGEDTSQAQAIDVRNLAIELEKWYLSVRNTSALPETAVSEDGIAAPSPVAYGLTGPLAQVLNASLVLSKAREGTYPTALDFSEALKELYEAARPLTDLILISGRLTDLGRVRNINEDSVMTLEVTVLEHEGNLPVGLYVIADGMGGHQSGEVASSIASRTIGAVVNSSLIGPMLAGDPVARDEATCANLLKQAVTEANRRIADLARERNSDLGTTSVAALVIGNQLSVANVGDSRAYLWHNGQLAPMTRDHSLVAQLVMAGQITPDEIYTHPRRNEIYRALGDTRLTGDEVDIYSHRLQPGDTLLLCSDGLWDFVRDPQIANVLGELEHDPQAACRALVSAANKEGGEDNISVILVRVTTADE